MPKGKGKGGKPMSKATKTVTSKKTASATKKATRRGSYG